jgi:phage FluMu protein gp41
MPQSQTETTTAQTGTETTPATPAPTSPPSSGQPPAGQQTTFSRGDVYADDDKKWKDKFHGYTGALNQQRQQAEARERELQGQIDALNQQIEAETARASSLETQLGDLRAQVELIPSLNKQIDELQAAQVSHERLAVMMEYPQLLGLTVTETVTNEDGAEEEVSHNPIRALIQSSTLEGDALRRQIEQLAKVYKVSAEPVEQTSTLDFNSPTVPSPASPAEESVESARTAALQLQRELATEGDFSHQARKAVQEAWEKVTKLEMEAAD